MSICAELGRQHNPEGARWGLKTRRPTSSLNSHTTTGVVKVKKHPEMFCSFFPSKECFVVALLLRGSSDANINHHISPHGSVVERVTSNDKVVSSILAVGIESGVTGYLRSAELFVLADMVPISGRVTRSGVPFWTTTPRWAVLCSESKRLDTSLMLGDHRWALEQASLIVVFGLSGPLGWPKSRRPASDIDVAGIQMSRVGAFQGQHSPGDPAV